MEKTLEVLNELERQGIIGRYAIGGSMAAVFYIEPFLTYTLDVLVSLPSDNLLFSLQSLYDYLAARGYKADREHVVIEGMLVQFLPAFNDLISGAGPFAPWSSGLRAPIPPASNDLIREAVTEPSDIIFENTSTRIIGPEFLVAIMTETGRRRDQEIIGKILEQATLNRAKLLDILKRHGLYEKWQRLSREFSDEG